MKGNKKLVSGRDAKDQRKGRNYYGALTNITMGVWTEEDIRALTRGKVPLIFDEDGMLWCNLCGAKCEPEAPVSSLRTHLMHDHGLDRFAPIPIWVTPFESDEDCLLWYMIMLQFRKQTYDTLFERRFHKLGFLKRIAHKREREHEENEWLAVLDLKRRASARAGKEFAIEKLREEHSLDDTDTMILITLCTKHSDIEFLRWRVRDEDEIMKAVSLSPSSYIDVLEYRRRLAKLEHEGLIYRVDNEPLSNVLYAVVPEVMTRILGSLERESDDDDELIHHRRNKEAVGNFEPASVAMSDVVLEDRLAEKVRTCITQWREKEKLFEKWGFGMTIKTGKGLGMLFSGPPGVGKTMLAQAIANELGLELYVIDYSKMVSCWVGETSKHIVQAFAIAKEHDAVLLFDEADALISARTGVHHCADREMNRDVNVFLQEIEKFEGIVILTTNLATNIDRALERRLAIKLSIKPPDLEARKAIWRKLVPMQAPLAEDVSFDELASKYDFTGGQIKNAALNAARIAVARGAECISQKDFIDGCRLEQEGEDAMDQQIVRCGCKEVKVGYI